MTWENAYVKILKARKTLCKNNYYYNYVKKK